MVMDDDYDDNVSMLAMTMFTNNDDDKNDKVMILKYFHEPIRSN